MVQQPTEHSSLGARAWRTDGLNADEAAAFAQRNAEPLAQLRTFIDFAEGFTLALAEVDFRADADALWALLRAAPGCDDVQMVGLWLGDPGLRFLREELADCVRAVVPQPGKRLVLVVGGLERSILIVVLEQRFSSPRNPVSSWAGQRDFGLPRGETGVLYRRSSLALLL